ncbi:molybdopterin-guanine dinucleotide biosynthesis protein B [Paenibacillus rhizosphaerae]|uniref:Molybdopterin-guanine dinucleotide biosynthesis protein B n=1 Tax=Paenibacillus rhizosphaerae TaxID=297318 RepID=A0A839TN49_9BACL|nr:molybdopterin-guanine dinucleotide biosynthesis protein B [Paenibacillus rhizosphaerae]MBB3127953.1 molybdopterin-guanine dinucleotide biosynthesis protein B [Paenibacillus rhizosphaerae]
MSRQEAKPPVWQIVGYKNSGKTTLVCSLVERLAAKGIRTAVIKHDAHDFDIDHTGTDSYRHRKSGAGAVALVSSRRTAVIEETETGLDELIGRFSGYDMILVEGFKQAEYPKLVMVRSQEDHALAAQITSVTAVVSWLADDVMKGSIELPPGSVPVFGVNDTGRIMEWLLHHVSMAPRNELK